MVCYRQIVRQLGILSPHQKYICRTHEKLDGVNKVEETVLNKQMITVLLMESTNDLKLLQEKKKNASFPTRCFFINREGLRFLLKRFV